MVLAIVAIGTISAERTGLIEKPEWKPSSLKLSGNNGHGELYQSIVVHVPGVADTALGIVPLKDHVEIGRAHV